MKKIVTLDFIRRITEKYDMTIDFARNQFGNRYFIIESYDELNKLTEEDLKDVDV